MNGAPNAKLSVAALFSLIILGGVLVWLAPVSAEQITPAQGNLLEIADWMVKASIGAILGLIGAQSLAARKPAVRNGG